jgi:hypothetical protein
MAFVKIDTHRHFSKAYAEPVAMGIYSSNGKDIKSRSVVFRIALDLCDQLWPTPDGEFLRLAVYEGTGKDAGFLQVHQDPLGYKVRHNKTHRTLSAYTISVVAVKFLYYTLNDTEAQLAPVQHVVDGNTLIVQCPDWLRVNPLTQPVVDEAHHLRATPPPPPKPTQPAMAQMKRPRGRPPKGGYRYS